MHSIKIVIVDKRMQKRETVLNFDCRCSMLLGVGQFIYLYIISFCLKVITFLDEKTTTVKPPNFWVLVKDITCFCLTNQSYLIVRNAIAFDKPHSQLMNTNKLQLGTSKVFWGGGSRKSRFSSFNGINTTSLLNIS